MTAYLNPVLTARLKQAFITHKTPALTKLPFELRHAIHFVAYTLCASPDFMLEALKVAPSSPSLDDIRRINSPESTLLNPYFRASHSLETLEYTPIAGLCHKMVLAPLQLEPGLSDMFATQYEILYGAGEATLDSKALVSGSIHVNDMHTRISYSEVHVNSAHSIARAITLASKKVPPRVWLLFPSSYLDIDEPTPPPLKAPLQSQKHTFRDILSTPALQLGLFVSRVAGPLTRLETVMQTPLKTLHDLDLFVFERDGVRSAGPLTVPESVVILVPPKLQAFEMVRLLIARLIRMQHDRAAVASTSIRVILMKPELLLDDAWELEDSSNYHRMRPPYLRSNTDYSLRTRISAACMNAAYAPFVVFNPSFHVRLGYGRTIRFYPGVQIMKNRRSAGIECVNVFATDSPVTRGVRYHRHVFVVPDASPNRELWISYEQNTALAATEIMEWLENNRSGTSVRLQIQWLTATPKPLQYECIPIMSMVHQFAMAFRIAHGSSPWQTPILKHVEFYYDTVPVEAPAAGPVRERDLAIPLSDLNTLLSDVVFGMHMHLQQYRLGKLQAVSAPWLPQPVTLDYCQWMSLATSDRAVLSWSTTLTDKHPLTITSRWKTWLVCETTEARTIGDIVEVVQQLLNSNDPPRVNNLRGTTEIPATDDAKFTIWNPSHAILSQSLDGLHWGPGPATPDAPHIGDITVIRCGGVPDARSLVFAANGMSNREYASPLTAGTWYFWLNYSINLGAQRFLDSNKAVRIQPMAHDYPLQTWTLSIVRENQF